MKSLSHFLKNCRDSIIAVFKNKTNKFICLIKISKNSNALYFSKININKKLSML